MFTTKQARTALQTYLNLRTDDSPYLFISYSHVGEDGHLSTNAIEELVKKYAKLADIHKKVTPHTLRHSFATSLIRK